MNDLEALLTYRNNDEIYYFFVFCASFIISFVLSDVGIKPKNKLFFTLFFKVCICTAISLFFFYSLGKFY